MKSNVTKHLSMRGTRVLVVVLSMLALTMGQKAWAIDYITDVMVIGHADKAEFDIMEDDLRAYGWTPIDKDLNAGCGSGSDYIHLLYKTSSSNTSSEKPITDFYISNEYKASITYQGRTYYPVPYKGSSSFEDSHGDLNNNAGGDFIFLYYTQDASKNHRAVTAISFNDTNSGAVGLNGGSTGYDLNAGTSSSSHYYMHLTTNAYVTTVTIGNGSKTVSIFPFSSTNYSITQQIYKAGEIGTDGVITSIAFRYNQVFSMRGVQLYMKHTDKSKFMSNYDFEPISASDMVYEGTDTSPIYSSPGKDWAVITLDKPFAYNGTDNLLICCYDPVTSNIDRYFEGYFHINKDILSLGYQSMDNIPKIENLPPSSDTNMMYFHRNDIQLNLSPNNLSNPANLRVSSGTDEMTTLSWDVPDTDETITGYVYQFKKVGDTDWSVEVTLNSATTSATINGLTALTDYQFRVKTLYGSLESIWATIRFTSAVPLPYECGFENDMDGWSMMDINWGQTGISTSAKHDGEKSFVFKNYYDGEHSPQYLISPPIANDESLQLSFYHFSNNEESIISIGYSTTTNDPDAFTWIDDINPAYIEWNKYEHIFPVGARYVAIRYDHTDDQFAMFVFLDVFIFEAYSTYARPTNLAVSNLTDQSATFMWKTPNNASPTDYAYQYKKNNETSWSREISVSGTSVTLNNLVANTNYDFRLKALYAGGKASNYIYTRFMTEGPAVSLPLTQDFENGMGSWRIVDGNLITGIYSEKDEFIHGGEKSFQFFSYSNNGSYQYLVSPELKNSPDMQVSFWYKTYSTATFQVGYSTTTKDPEAFTWGQQTFTSNTGWKEYITYFPAGTKYVAVKRIFGNYLYVDDFTFTQSVLPAVPQQLEANNITAHTADISWTGDAETYQVRYRTASLLYENFENGFNEWKVVNQGGTANTDWNIVYMEIDNNHYVVTGCYDESTRKAYAVDNWLISPQVTLDGTLKYMAAQNKYCHVYYEVLVSTTTNELNAFTMIATPPPPVGDLFEEVTIDLKSYHGQKGYIAFRLKEGEDSEGDNLGIDHVGIYRDNYFSTWLLKDTTGENATVFGLDPLTLYECQVRSIVNDYYSPWSDVMTFTTPETTPITTDGAELQDKVQSSKIKYQSESWFTIDGRKLNGKPKGKGVYIHNGKKAVVN